MAWNLEGQAQVQLSTANTGSVNIAVPANTEILLVYVTGYDSTANIFSGGGMTIGGAAMTNACSGADDSTSAFMGNAFYKVSPSTGTQALAWDWSGTGTLINAAQIWWVAYSGVDTADAVRGSIGTQHLALQYSTGSLTASSGDRISVCAFGYCSSEGSITTWSNATGIAEGSRWATPSSDMTLAYHDPSGNVTIATTAGVAYEDGGILAIVMKPAAGGASSTPVGIIGGGMGRIIGG